MSGYARSTEQRAAVADHRDPARSAPTSQELLQDDPESGNPARSDPGRRLAAFAAGSVAAIGGIAALHGLYRSGDGAAELVGWAGLLLLAMTALGGGIKLAMWGARPVITALFDGAKERLAEAVLAVVASGAVIVGALGMWWTLRGGYASWWQHLTGESRWSLSLGVGQMLVAVAAGAALFTGGRYVTGLAKDALTESGLLIERDRAAGRRRAPEGLWHPGLVAALIGGGLGLVLLAAGITPRLYVWITGPDVLPAVAAIAVVLLWAIGSNLGWWKGLAGLWQWATDASHKTAAMSGVVALLMFSAGGLGLGWFTPATVPQAHAQCPPDCGGGSNGGSYGPDASQFQPPQMPSQMPDYQGGINQPPLDQNGSISIYNTQAPSISNNGSSGQQGPQQSWDQPAHGTQIPDYQNATPYTQGPGRPNPDFNPGSQGGQANPGSDAGSQGGQPNQGVQQQAPQQPQENPAQQPDQQPQQSDSQRIDDLTRQLQDQQQQSTQDRQRIDDLTKQLQQQGQQKQNGNQKLPKAPSKDKKQDDKDQQQDRDDQSQNNDLSALLLGAASTRRRKHEQQGPDTEALGQDASQAVQGLPGDVQTYVQSGQQIGQSSGQAAQGFGSAAQAGASLASSAQSGAVNPQDAITVVQGVSQGIQGTADAINAGSQIVKTAQGEADQVAQAVGDANPSLRPQMDQARQLNQQAGQITDLVGQGSQLTSQGAGAVNSVSGMGSGGLPDTSGSGVPDALGDPVSSIQADGYSVDRFADGSQYTHVTDPELRQVSYPQDLLPGEQLQIDPNDSPDPSNPQVVRVVNDQGQVTRRIGEFWIKDGQGRDLDSSISLNADDPSAIVQQFTPFEDSQYPLLGDPPDDDDTGVSLATTDQEADSDPPGQASQQQVDDAWNKYFSSHQDVRQFFLDGVFPTGQTSRGNRFQGITETHMSDGSTLTQTLSLISGKSETRVDDSPLLGNAYLHVKEGTVSPASPQWVDTLMAALGLLDAVSTAALFLPGVDVAGIAGKAGIAAVKESTITALKGAVKDGAEIATIKATASNAAKLSAAEQLAKNAAVGNAFRDSLVSELGGAARGVRREVTYSAGRVYAGSMLLTLLGISSRPK
ncbi:putative membrane protein [Mycobacteroides abscessus MAB_091912_2446]|uniref:Putative membrane protein n=1 Tax=Mycobacteroides abscessus MAB_091912_2446 TaxID=1335414 RepID=A0A829MIJ8_9MYCO|nr:putative membrane protein [Mycobacteroides abscessus MAB_091912_2446]